jgi:hypothetical protein
MKMKPRDHAAIDLIDQLERWYLTPDDYNQINDFMCHLAQAHFEANDIPADFEFKAPKGFNQTMPRIKDTKDTKH